MGSWRNKQVTSLVDCVALGWGSVHDDGVIMLTGVICIDDGVIMLTGVICIEDGVTLRNDRGHMVDGHPHKPKEGRAASTVCQTATV